MANSNSWDAELYSRFLNERTRPAAELAERVPLLEVKCAFDLGCGPGNSTAVIKARFPDARVSGVDNSPEMLEKARSDYPDLSFELADVALWTPGESCDLIFSNATFQWVADHEKHFVRLLRDCLSPQGVLAVQMPDNFNEPTHSLMREVAADGGFSVDLKGIRETPPVLKAGDYYDLLCPLCSVVDIWQTRYFHVLDSLDAVVDWLAGTGLRPFLEPLVPAEQAEFRGRYKERLGSYIKPRADGKVLLPFPRLFVVAKSC